MSAQASYFRLGLFVLAAIGLLLAGVIALGAGEWFQEGIMVETYVDESVAGLTVGSPVKNRGVQIGKVSRIGFVTSKYRAKSVEDEVCYGKYVLIEMEIDPEALPRRQLQERRDLLRRRVESGLRFRLQSSLTGPTYLETTYVDPNVRKPMSINWKPEYLYVPSDRGVVAQVTSAVERLASEIEKAEIAKGVENINRLAVALERAVEELQVAKLSKEVLTLSAGLRKITARLQQIIDNPAIDQGIADLGVAAAGIKEVVSTSKGDITATLKDLPKITARLSTTAEEIDRIVKSAEMKQLIAGLSDTAEHAGPAMIRLRKTAQRLDNLLASQQKDIEAVITGLRRTVENLSSLSEDAAENPSRVLFGDPPPKVEPGEKK